METARVIFFLENTNYYYKLKVKKYQDMFIILKIEINGFSRPVGPLYPPPWLIGLRIISKLLAIIGPSI